MALVIRKATAKERIVGRAAFAPSKRRLTEPGKVFALLPIGSACLLDLEESTGKHAKW